MTANQWAQAVRTQLKIGRVLPLGGPADGSWITEQAAAGVLRTAAGTPPGVRLGSLRLSVADPDRAPEPAVPAPPSALPPGPLRIEADFAATGDRPLPTVADQVRAALLEASVRELGLVVAMVDLRVSGLLDEASDEAAGAPQAPPAAPVAEERSGATQDGAAGIAAVVLDVTGVARLAPVLGSSRPVRLTDGHALIQLATAPGHRALDVAAAVRQAVAAAPPAVSTVAVLVTAVEQG
ncbi:hypothetical protein BX264_1508 [Streptomyces sp. 2333.5]|uniref:hypothetical protein n=1 Tax=unclassified Streptomyces TaxID=2593676 RepID=UPI000896B975|nr:MULTISPECIES: hypothetical protein [unclassified Streptomyces]PJJ01204.1 hypothetical protein BX264_1508 [Streptomyces sp. 2333.5]SEC46675.1 hypothetical protein SAMN05428943_1654 [Streptomyces sp. 2314.4]SED26110.1 hypothetical protein SAMN05428942_1524 [Streptomyces sp. 2112.2]